MCINQQVGGHIDGDVANVVFVRPTSSGKTVSLLGSLCFAVEPNARGQTRVIYSVEQYKRLIGWLRDTFGD